MGFNEKLWADTRRNASKRQNYNNFERRNILVSGDSITEGTGTTTKAWHEYLADWFECTIKNDGKSATGLIRNNGGTLGAFYRIDDWASIYGGFDCILFMGNMNDGGLGQSSFPVGTFTDSVATASQYGAWHSTIQKLISKFPNKPIGIIISTPRLSNTTYPSPNDGKAWGNDGWFEPYCQSIIAVCKHYSIPYLDLYHSSGLRPWDATNKSAYFDSVGVHPNADGHEIMANKIYEFVRQYMNGTWVVEPVTPPTNIVQNLITDGQMESNIDNFETFDTYSTIASSSLHSVSSSKSTEVTVKSGQVAGVLSNDSTLNAVSFNMSHIYYTEAYIRIPISDVDAQARLSFKASAGATLLGIALNYETIGTTEWKRISGIGTPTATSAKVVEITVNNLTTGSKFYVDDFIVVDLTEIYGAGNEPNLTWCNDNIKNNVIW